MSKDKFIEMLKSTKTAYKIISDNANIQPFKKHISDVFESIEVQNTKREVGHCFITSSWFFDKDGKFLAVGHYEDMC